VFQTLGSDLLDHLEVNLLSRRRHLRTGGQDQYEKKCDWRKNPLGITMLHLILLNWPEGLPKDNVATENTQSIMRNIARREPRCRR
jgi:hypothetical protein